MTREEIIDGLEIYTVGRSNKAKVNITVEELQKFINEIKTLKQEPVLEKITELIEPLRHLSFDEMSDVEWQILGVIDKVQDRK